MEEGREWLQETEVMEDQDEAVFLDMTGLL